MDSVQSRNIKENFNESLFFAYRSLVVDFADFCDGELERYFDRSVVSNWKNNVILLAWSEDLYSKL